MSESLRMSVRLPEWAVNYLDENRKENMTSRNVEIIKAIKIAKEKSANEAVTSPR